MKGLAAVGLLVVPVWGWAAVVANQAAHVFKGTESPFVEVSFGIETHSITWLQTENGWRAGCEVTIFVRQGNALVNADKFDLISGALPSEPTDTSFTLYGLRRIALDPGSYSIWMELTDLADTMNRSVLPEQSIVAPDFEEAPDLSDIQFFDVYTMQTQDASWFSKNGIYYRPLLYPFYPTEARLMHFYAEIYGMDKAHAREDFLLRYMIRRKGWTEPIEGFLLFEKQKGDAVNVVLGSFDLGELPSGSYEFVIEVRNRGNELLATQTAAFMRSNKLSVSDLSSIRLLDVSGTFAEACEAEMMPFYLKSLKPRATSVEQRAIDDLIATNDTVLMRKFLYNFWVARNPSDPAGAWKDYLVMVNYVNGKYDLLNRHGFETERGRVYLQYGPPNDIFESRFEAGTKPYEIWQYNIIPNGETNVVFVFFNDDLVSNDYRLIHSTATGEVHNQRWKLLINDEFQYEESKDFDQTEPRDRMGSQTYEIIPD